MERLVFTLTAAIFISLLDFAACDTPGIDSYQLLSGGGRFRLHTDKQSYDAAMKVCALEEARLAVPTSRVIQDLMIQLLQTANVNMAYIGVDDLKYEGKMLTAKGELYSEVGYSQFAYGEPNNHEGVEDCIIINTNGQLNDMPCSEVIGFFCERVRTVPHYPF